MQNAYRISAGATMFETRDPDPNAVNGGRIIGIRIELYNQRMRSYSHLREILNTLKDSSPLLTLEFHSYRYQDVLPTILPSPQPTKFDIFITSYSPAHRSTLYPFSCPHCKLSPIFAADESKAFKISRCPSFRAGITENASFIPSSEGGRQEGC